MVIFFVILLKRLHLLYNGLCLFSTGKLLNVMLGKNMRIEVSEIFKGDLIDMWKEKCINRVSPCDRYVNFYKNGCDYNFPLSCLVANLNVQSFEKQLDLINKLKIEIDRITFSISMKSPFNTKENLQFLNYFLPSFIHNYKPEHIFPEFLRSLYKNISCIHIRYELCNVFDSIFNYVNKRNIIKKECKSFEEENCMEELNASITILIWNLHTDVPLKDELVDLLIVATDKVLKWTNTLNDNKYINKFYHEDNDLKEINEDCESNNSFQLKRKKESYFKDLILSISNYVNSFLKYKKEDIFKSGNFITKIMNIFFENLDSSFSICNSGDKELIIKYIFSSADKSFSDSLSVSIPPMTSPLPYSLETLNTTFSILKKIDNNEDFEESFIKKYKQSFNDINIQCSLNIIKAINYTMAIEEMNEEEMNEKMILNNEIELRKENNLSLNIKQKTELLKIATNIFCSSCNYLFILLRRIPFVKLKHSWKNFFKESLKLFTDHVYYNDYNYLNSLKDESLYEKGKEIMLSNLMNSNEKECYLMNLNYIMHLRYKEDIDKILWINEKIERGGCGLIDILCRIVTGEVANCQEEYKIINNSRINEKNEGYRIVGYRNYIKNRRRALERENKIFNLKECFRILFSFLFPSSLLNHIFNSKENKKKITKVQKIKAIKKIERINDIIEEEDIKECIMLSSHLNNGSYK